MEAVHPHLQALIHLSTPQQVYYAFFKKLFKIIYFILFLAALGLRCFCLGFL